MEPWLHPLWKMAEAYGARCSARCEDSITHVVASSRGTEKTCWAAQHGRAVVTPAWLECCSSLWRKANEERFATPFLECHTLYN
ncbi:hypothetical protein DUNSADRAFT_17253 [Dunaliella salina]|uniref:protein-serine/threonine phosphatase n=1 Tax=Dunaliella salina TaxID=3046 RepID=A0ABQ7H0B1_DUNSA|nr:hypothetical protein DUNSADRAFT_17253 [Dunaliella salina]|eukprot:KAF5840284.1 hypothetical protein DUNSADRAFT_17253 [Dunaliella salina]